MVSRDRYEILQRVITLDISSRSMEWFHRAGTKCYSRRYRTERTLSGMVSPDDMIKWVIIEWAPFRKGDFTGKVQSGTIDHYRLALV